MKDEQILENLYTLQGLKSPESDNFIAKWIDCTLVDISLSSAQSLGQEQMTKILAKYIKKNGKLLKTSKLISTYVLISGNLSIKLMSDFGMPVTKDRTSIADGTLKLIEDTYRSRKEKILLPEWHELQTIIKAHKAMGKSASNRCAEYCFGKDLPTFNAQQLLDVSRAIPTPYGYLVDNKLLIDLAPYRAVLISLKKGDS